MAVWRDLLDLILPRRCVLCGGAAGEGDLCGACRESLGKAHGWRCLACGALLPAIGAACCAPPERTALDALWAAFDYGPAVRDSVHRVKFGRDHRLCRSLGRLTARLAARGIPLPAAEVVPVPLSRRRARERGFDQAVLLAREIGRAMQVPLADGRLARVRDIPPQATLDAAARRANPRGAFAAAGRRGAPGGIVLLVDDVYTTGATMDECARVMKEAGATLVAGAVFACAPREGAAEGAPAGRGRG
jgi:ComF family protein